MDTIVKKDYVVKKDYKRSQKRLRTINNKDKFKDKFKDIAVFDFWNESKIIIHKDFLQFKLPIKKALSKFSVEEITGSIRNYAVILHDDQYFWSYKWTLKEFLSRGLEKFLEINNPLENFKKWKDGKIKQGFKRDTKQDYESGFKEAGFDFTVV